MAKVRGDDIYVEVNTGTIEVPVWTKVGGQKDASMTRSLGDIDVTDKDSDGWEENLAGNRGLEVEFDAFLIEDDDGFAELEKGFDERKDLNLRLTTPAAYFTGMFRLTELSNDAPLGDAAGVSFSLKATGEVTKSAHGA